MAGLPTPQISISSIYSTSSTLQGEIRGIDWKQVIFIPFSPFWQVLMLVTVMASEFQVIYNLGYSHLHLSNVEEVFFYIMDTIYLIDTGLYLLHIMFARKRSLKSYLPKRKLFMVLDVISLIPVDVVYKTLIVDKTGHWPSLHNALRCRILLRSYRIRLRRLFTKYQISTIHANYFLFIFMINHTLGAVWYVLTSDKPGGPAQSSHYMVDAVTTAGHSWNIKTYALFFCLVNTVVGHGGITYFIVFDNGESIFLAVTLIFGYSISLVYLCATLLPIFRNKIRRQMSISRRIHNIKQYLENWQGKPSVTSKSIIHYYQSLWRYLYGLEVPPSLYNKLPSSLQKDAQMDMFWDAFKHSNLFSNVDLALKRALSLKMKSEFLLPGDILFKPNCAKNRMIYIVSGLIHIFSTEDDLSPILSFSSGTCIGETSLLMIINSGVYCRSATYCEIFTIDFCSFYQVMCNFRDEYHLMRKNLATRLENAQNLIEIHRSVHVIGAAPVLVEILHKQRDIIWLKKRLRQLASLQAESTQRRIPDSMLQENTLIEHCSDYLNLLSLSEEVELKLKVIFLRSELPFIFEPKSNFMKRWKVLVIIVIAVVCTIYPYWIFFKREIGGLTNMYFTLFCDVIFIVDIYIECSTAVKVKGIIVVQLRKIFIHRLKQISFLMDVISSFPLNYLAIAAVSSHSEVLLLSNRLLKIYKLFEFLNVLQSRMSVHMRTVRVYKYFIIYFFVIYWAICFFYAAACFYPVCFANSWASSARFKETQENLQINAHPVLYTLLYMSTSLSFSYVVLYPVELTDLITAAIFLIILDFVYITCFSEYVAIKFSLMRNQLRYNEFRDAILTFIQKYDPPIQIKRDLLSYLKYQWDHNEGVTLTREIMSIRYASNHPRVLPNFETYIECLKNIPLFQDVSRNMLLQICDTGSIYYLPPGSQILKQGFNASHLYYIYEGFCSMDSLLPGDQIYGKVSIVGPETHFPMIALLYNEPMVISVKTVTCCTIVAFDYNKIRKIIKLYPTFHKEIQNLIRTSKNYFDNLFSKKNKTVIIKMPEYHVVKIKMFEYEQVKSTTAERRRMLEGYSILSSFQVLKYCLLPRTFHPESTFILYWEIIRGVVAIVSSLVMSNYYGVLNLHDSFFLSLRCILDCFGLIDMYIRIHIGYYNKNAIYVSHPAWTATNYFSKSFVTDIFSILPYDLMQIDSFFGQAYKRLYRSLLFTVSRSLPLYRTMGLISYFQSYSNVSMTIQFYSLLKDFMLIICLVNALAANQLYINCRMMQNNPEEIEPRCKGHFSRTRLEMFVFSVFFVVSLITRTGSNIYELYTPRQLFVYLVQAFIFYCVKSIYFAKEMYFLVGGNVNLTEFQGNMHRFLRFAENEIVFEEVIDNTIKHYKYIWSRTKGIYFRLALRKLHISLREDIVMFLYGPSLKSIKLFESVNEKFLRTLGVMVQEVYFLKGCDVIRTNDLQDKMYFVHRGSLEVRLGPDMLIAKLKPGSMFGCFNATQKMRHRLIIRTSEKTDLLMIKSSKLFDLIEGWPLIKKRMDNALMFNPEFIESNIIHSKESELLLHSINIRTSAPEDDQKNFNVKTLFRNRNLRWQMDVVWYNRLSLIFHVIGPCITLYVVPLHFGLHVSSGVFMAIIYMLDALYYIKIYIDCQMEYSDITGEMNHNVNQVFRDYMKHPNRFLLDLLTVFPFEVFSVLMSGSKYHFEHLKVNRTLRFVYLIRYFRRCKHNLSISNSLRWVYILSGFLLTIHVSACIQIHYNCSENYCIRTGYYRLKKEQQTRKVMYADGKLSMIILGYLFMIDQYCGVSLLQISPQTMQEAMFISFMTIILQMTFIFVVSGVAGILQIKYKSFMDYEYKLLLLTRYFENRKLSYVLVHKLKDYCVQLWLRAAGSWIPQLILDAPSYLQQDLMEDLYGHHLLNNVLFKETHTHFLRQLVTRLERCMYFPGDTIVHKGDVDYAMFFIHLGEVHVFEKIDGEDSIEQTLSTNQQFGVLQGLQGIPYKRTFRAKSVVDILILRRDNWTDLFDAFPASRETILLKSLDKDLETIVPVYKRVRVKSSKLKDNLEI